MEKIYTGLTALYDLGFSNFKPNYLYIELPRGTNTTNFSSKYKISIQSLDTISIGVIKYENKLYYSPERLFIEIDKYKIENTVKKRCLDSLIKEINPQKVLEIYKKLKSKRRGIDRKRVEDYLDRNLLLIDKYFERHDDKAQILREYILALMGKKDFPLSIIKGGSAIELFVPFKRATEDIDTHVDSDDIKKIEEYLTNKELLIYFDIKKQEKESTIIKKWKLIPKSRKIKLNETLKKVNLIELNLNTTYSKEELNSIIKEFNIIKQPLKNIKNATVTVFNSEMLLAEKFQSLISKPDSTTRTKDLVDLYFIYHNQEIINFDNFKKWVFFKWKKSNRNPLDENNVIKKINENKKTEFKHLKENFSSAIKMYQEKDIKFEDAKKIFFMLCEKFL